LAPAFVPEFLKRRLARFSPTSPNDQTARTMSVVLAAAQSGMGQWAWPRIAAVDVIVVTRGIIAFAFAQRLFFMEGAVKA
jgi:hypothetical protein